MKARKNTAETIPDWFPEHLRDEAKSLLARDQEKPLEGEELFRKRLVLSEAMRKVWERFEKDLSLDQFKSATSLLFDKAPKLVQRGYETRFKQEDKDRLDALDRYLDEKEADILNLRELNLAEKGRSSRTPLTELRKTLKMLKIETLDIESLNARIGVDEVLDSITREIEDAKQAILERDYSIAEEFGDAYAPVWDSRKRLDESAIQGYTIRSLFILFKECGFVKPPLEVVGIAATAMLESEDIYEQKVRSYVSKLLDSPEEN